MRPVANPKKNPSNIRRKTDISMLAISSGAPEEIKTSKNKNIEKIIRGKRQTFIFLEITFILEILIFPKRNAIKILIKRPTNRKISGTLKLKTILPMKSKMGAIRIGSKL
jgi:hypothetical protein